MELGQFGRYRLLDLIGAGGMGRVYRAHDAQIGRDVALKVLPAELAREPGYRERFRREALIAARLNEPHVIPIHDVGEIDEQLYLVMPVIDGVDVAALIKRDGPMDPRLAVAVIDQLAAALDAAHARGLIHRDVKPSNALVSGAPGREFVYLIDFGIAHDTVGTRMTRTGSVLGTLAYMAPERFSSEAVDARSDIYALACVLYECLTASPPFVGDMQQQITGHMTQDPPRPSAKRPGLPAGFDQVVARGMAKDPGQRYQSAHELAQAAARALTGPVAVAPRAVVSSSRRRRALATVGGGVAVAIVVALVGFLIFGRTPAKQATPSPSPQAAPAPVAAKQVTLPIAGLGSPDAVAVDAAGAVYVCSSSSPTHPVVKLAAGANSRTVLPFEDLFPTGIAVDPAGDVYVVGDQPGSEGDKLLKLASGSDAAVPVPLDGQLMASGLAVDSAGTLYISLVGEHSVLQLAAGSRTPLHRPRPPSDVKGLAVDSVGNIYFTSLPGDVYKLAPGSDTATKLPFYDLKSAWGVAVDAGGSVYVTDFRSNRVLKLPAGSQTTTALPFTGLDQPKGVAVDSAGNVYVADSQHARVVKLLSG